MSEEGEIEEDDELDMVLPPIPGRNHGKSLKLNSPKKENKSEENRRTNNKNKNSRDENKCGNSDAKKGCPK